MGGFVGPYVGASFGVDEPLLGITSVDNSVTLAYDVPSGVLDLHVAAPTPPASPVVKAFNSEQLNGATYAGNLYTPSSPVMVRVSFSRTTEVAASTSLTIGAITLTFFNGDIPNNVTLVIPAASLIGPALAHNTSGDTYTVSVLIQAWPGATIAFSWASALVDGGGTHVSDVCAVAEQVSTLV